MEKGKKRGQDYLAQARDIANEIYRESLKPTYTPGKPEETFFRSVSKTRSVDDGVAYADQARGELQERFAQFEREKKEKQGSAYNAAAKLYEKALEEGLDDGEARYAALSEGARCYFLAGKIEKSKEMNRKAGEVFREIRDSRKNLTGKLVSVLALLGSIFFLSTNITGNVISGFAQNTTNAIGAGLFFLGIVVGFFYFKK